MNLNKWKILVLILLLTNIISISVAVNTKNNQKRYVKEDMEQLREEISKFINNSKVEIDNISINNEETRMKIENLENLMTYNRNIDRNIFNFYRKTRFFNSEFSNKFRKIWESINFNDEINYEDISDFYDGLLDRADEDEYIMLNTDDVDMFQEILSLYYKIRKDIAIFNEEIM